LSENKKRKYTFRKDQDVPYEAGSIMHIEEKEERKARKKLRDDGW